MRMLIMPVVAITLWSIESIGAVPTQGSVTMKINPSHGLVNLGELKVSTGDHVVVYKKSCVGPKLPVCKTQKVGSGRVVRVLNENYSEIEIESGVMFQEGFVVKKE